MQLKKIERENTTAQSSRFTERIGSTTYRVTMHFPEKEDESLEAKILRLIKNSLSYQAENGTMGSLQTGRLPDGGSL